MEEDALHFYINKMRLMIGFIFLTPLFFGISTIVYVAYEETIWPVFLVLLFIGIFIGLIWLSVIRRLFNQNPYITITNSSILINPNTKDEIKIVPDNITTVRVIESYFQKRIQFVLREEDILFKKLSLLSKIIYGLDKLFGLNIIQIDFGLIKRHERALFLKVFDDFLTQAVSKKKKATILKDFPDPPKKIEEEILKKYDAHHVSKLVINFQYFKKAYIQGLVIFLFMLVLFYFLLDQGDFYLIYIIISFFTYPFAKLFLDRLGMYKLRQKIDKQIGGYYLQRALLFFDSILFHISIYLTPLGLLVLIVDLIIKKIRSQRNS